MISTKYDPIPYPNRPILSLFIAFCHLLLSFVPFMPMFLGLGAAVGTVIDDLISWTPIYLVNSWRAFKLERKRIKTTLMCLAIIAAIALAIYFNTYGFPLPIYDFLSSFIIIIRSELEVGFLAFGVTIFASIAIVKTTVELMREYTNYNVSMFNSLYIIIAGMLLAQFVFMPLLPESLMMNALNLDIYFLSVTLFPFVAAISMKFVLKFIYSFFLGHSNSDGWCYQNKDNMFSAFFGIRRKLADEKFKIWQQAFTECGVDNPRELTQNVLDFALACRRLKCKGELGYFKRFNQIMSFDTMYKTARNGALDSLATVHDRESAEQFLSFIKPHYVDALHKFVDYERKINPTTDQLLVEKFNAIRKLINKIPNLKNENNVSSESLKSDPLPISSFFSGDSAQLLKDDYLATNANNIL